MKEVGAMEKLKHERIVQYIRHEVVPDDRVPGIFVLSIVSPLKVINIVLNFQSFTFPLFYVSPGQKNPCYML